VRREVDTMKEKVRMKRDITSSAKVDVEIRWIIPNTGFSMSKESKYTKTVNLCWHIKDLIPCGIKSRGIEENTILQMLEQMDFMYDVLINAIWNIKLENEDKAIGKEDKAEGCLCSGNIGTSLDQGTMKHSNYYVGTMKHSNYSNQYEIRPRGQLPNYKFHGALVFLCL
jgi:hypothetical protein